MKKYKSSSVLKLALSRIKKQNSAISIRGLASKLEISHVFLSRVLSGKAPLPETRLKDFVKVFQLDPFAEKELKDAMVADLAATRKINRILQVKKNSKKKKAIDIYEERPVKHQVLLENWYELPILDYLTCTDVPKDTESIAQRLALKTSQVAQALKKMEDAQLITKNDQGQWVKTIQFIRFPAAAPSGLLKKYYTDVLKRTTAELHKDSQEDYERRLVINFSIATAAQRIPEVKERLSQFLYDLSVEMADGPADEVYHLTLGLVPLTNSKGNR